MPWWVEQLGGTNGSCYDGEHGVRAGTSTSTILQKWYLGENKVKVDNGDSINSHLWLSQVVSLSSKHSVVSRKTRKTCEALELTRQKKPGRSVCLDGESTASVRRAASVLCGPSSPRRRHLPSRSNFRPDSPLTERRVPVLPTGGPHCPPSLSVRLVGADRRLNIEPDRLG